MKALKFLTRFTMMLSFPFFVKAQNPLYSPAETRKAAKHYIRAYKPMAHHISRTSGLPPHIILAVAGLESNWGRSELAVYAKNHFGIKAVDKWKGKVYWKTSGEYIPGSGVQHYKSAFRHYSSVSGSYEDFGTYMRARGLYDDIFRIPAHDYHAWAQALQDCGYASDKNYAEKIIRVVEEYQLVEPPVNKVSKKQGILLNGSE